MTAAEKLIKEGFERGLERGLERGREQERRVLLLRLLGQRFGALPEALRSRVGAAGTDELQGWFDRVLGAETLDEIFAET